MNRKIIIGGAWPYANSSLHLGHLAALISGDVLARYHRLNGDNVIYVSGTDCHGTPITERAKKEKITAKEIAEKYHKQFKEEFEKIAKEKEVDKIIPILNLDAEIKLDDVNKEMVDSLKELEPFGEANKMPIFAFRNLKIDSIRSLSEGKHLRLSVKDNKNIINAIGFNMGVLADTYRIGDRVDIAGNLEINSFNGVDSIQINIKDIMKSI